LCHNLNIKVDQNGKLIYKEFLAYIFTEHLPTWSILTAAGHATGPEISACVTVAQLRTGHSPLLAAYLHRIGRRDSATCPHCNGADETAENLVGC